MKTKMTTVAARENARVSKPEKNEVLANNFSLRLRNIIQHNFTKTNTIASSQQLRHEYEHHPSIKCLNQNEFHSKTPEQLLVHFNIEIS